MVPDVIQIALIAGLSSPKSKLTQYTIFFYGKNVGFVEQTNFEPGEEKWMALMDNTLGYGKTKEDAVLDAIKKQMVVYDNNKTDVMEDDPEVKDYFARCEKETGEKRDDYTF